MYGDGIALPEPAVPIACHPAAAPGTAGPPSSAKVRHASH